MARHSNKQALLDAGLRVMFKHGFNGAAVRDVVATAGVHQGSFTNHHVQRLVEASFNDRSLSPRARMERYLDLIVERLQADGFKRGCLIGDLSIEMTQTSELIRDRLQIVFEQWLQPFAECIAEGQSLGEFSSDFGAQEIADYFLASWEGAILRMKVERSIAPLNRFRKIFFATITCSGATNG